MDPASLIGYGWLPALVVTASNPLSLLILYAILTRGRLVLVLVLVLMLVMVLVLVLFISEMR